MAVSFTPTTVASPSGVQGSYPLTMEAGLEGGLADLQAYVSRSYFNQTGAAIAFGAPVQLDPTGGRDPLAARMAITVTNVLGITTHSNTFEGAQGSVYTRTPSPILADGRMGYPDKQALNVVSKGVLWVYSCEAVAIGDAVRFFAVTHDPTLAGAHVGRWGKTAVANKSVAVSGGARWLSKTSAAGLALLEIDLPGATFTLDT
jgi:hypothetical protein